MIRKHRGRNRESLFLLLLPVLAAAQVGDDLSEAEQLFVAPTATDELNRHGHIRRQLRVVCRAKEAVVS